ncbi:hypothetical protein N0V95_004403 [Ascochyta clinopodiicola]|nr:hypothetical protein N0V95_004403 [Ascochyta clinopodiicola]
MTWLKNINPTPSFPAYTGPHKVGSIDVEVPTSELENPSDDAPPADLPTVAFRVFYPCRQDSEQKPVRWIPSPQREYIAAYARFLGANIAPDHRDGSSPINFIHTNSSKDKPKRVDYRRIDHKPSTDVYNARDEQLRIRLWEIGLIHDAVLKIDTRQRLKNVAEDATKSSGKDMLTMFSHLLSVHEPGSISIAGHSFGAATAVQLVKSVYHTPTNAPASYTPLFTPRASSTLKTQITPHTPLILLDLWTLPIQSPTTAWLRAQPLPAYTSPQGGSSTLAILSEGFFKWTSNLTETKRILAKPPTAPSSQPGPHIFYPTASAHLSQSDFGILFPWATAKVFGAKEPERVLRLNTRAVLQVLRNSGVEVSRTSAADLEFEGVEADKVIENDDGILSTRRDRVRGWINIGEEAQGDAGVQEAKVGTGPGEAVLQGEAFGQAVEDGAR